MATTPFQMKRSTVAGKVPLYTDLEVGELALNLADKKIFTRGTSNNIVQLADTHKYTKEWHVDPTNGDDTNGTGAEGSPYKTIAKALLSAGNTGCSVMLHAGTYTETVTVTNLNVDIVAASGAGGLVNCSGAWTFNSASSSVRCFGLSFTGGITISSAGGTYFKYCQSTGTVTKSGGGYVEVRESDFGGTGFNVTGAGTTSLKDTIVYLPKVANVSAAFAISGSPTVMMANVNAGTMVIDTSYVYSSSNTANAVTTGATGLVYLYNSHVVTPSATIGRINVGSGFWSINDTQYDKANSNVAGTNLGTVNYFDALNVQGNITLATSPSSNVFTASTDLVLNGSNVVAKRGAYTVYQSVKDNTIATPPSTPAADDRYLVAASPTGDWSTFANQIVTWSGSAWVATGAPALGDTVVVTSGTNAGKQYTHNGTAWTVNAQAQDLKVTPWALNAAYGAGTVVVKEGLLYQAAGAIAANTAFAEGVYGAKWKAVGGSGSGGGNAEMISNGTSNVKIADADGNITMSVDGIANVVVVYANESNVANVAANTVITTTVKEFNIDGIANLSSEVVSNANSESSVTTTTTTKLVTLGEDTNIKYANVDSINVANTSNAYYPVVIDSEGVISKQPVIATLASVIDNTLTEPPESPAIGESYIVAATATGDWAGEEKHIATFDGAEWVFYTPQANDTTTVTSGVNAGVVYIFKDGSWTNFNSTAPLTLSSWAIGVSYSAGAIVVKDGGLYQANSNIPVNTAFSVGQSGATWKPLSSAGTMPAEYGEVVMSSVTAINAGTTVDIGTFTLPSAGTWEIEMNLRGSTKAANAFVTGFITDSSNNAVANSSVILYFTNSFVATANDIQTSATQTVRITTSGATTYKLRATSNGAVGGILSDGSGYTKVAYKKLNGFIPATGAQAGYSKYKRGAGQTTGLTTGGIIICDVPESSPTTSNISHNLITGQITLAPGNTYRLRGGVPSYITNHAESRLAIAWYNETAGAYVGEGLYHQSTTSAAQYGATGSVAEYTFTPAVTTVLSLRISQISNITSLGGNTDYPLDNSYPWVEVEQLGTTNVSAFLGTLQNDWSINNAYPSGAIVTKNSLLYQAQAAIPAQTVWVEGTSGQTWKQIGGGVVAEQGQVYTSTGSGINLTAAWQAIPGLQFTVPTNGTYEFNAQSVRGGAQSRLSITYAVDGSAKDEFLQHEGYGAYESGLTETFVATLTAGQVITIVAKNTDGTSGAILNDGGRRPSLRWKKISGFVPTTGTALPYATMGKTSSQTISANNQDLTWDTRGGSLTTASTTVTLLAGVTYEMNVSIAGGQAATETGAAAYFKFVNTTTGTDLPLPQVLVLPVTWSGSGFVSFPSTSVIYTPSTNMTVKLTSASIAGSTTVTSNSMWTVKQIGTTSTSAFTGTLSNQWSINNSYPSGTIVNNGGFLYQANTAIPSGTPFTVGTTGSTWGLLNVQQAEYGNAVLAGDYTNLAVDTPFDAVTFTLPSAGVWSVSWTACTEAISNSGATNAWISDASNNVIAKSGATMFWANATTGQSSGSRTVQITTTGAQTFKLRVLTIAAASRVYGTDHYSGGSTGVTWTKISGFLPLQPKTITEKITIGALTTAPTKASNAQQDYITITDDNSGWCDIVMDYRAIGGLNSAAGNGHYLFTLPAGYQFDTTIHPVLNAAAGINSFADLSYELAGSLFQISNSTSHQYFSVLPYSATQFRLVSTTNIQSSSGLNSCFGSAYFALNESTAIRFGGRFKFKKA